MYLSFFLIFQFPKYELNDVSVDDLPTEDDSVDFKMDSGNNHEQEVESCVKTLSETSSLRDRNMKRQLDKFATSLKAVVKKEPIHKEKRTRKLTAQLKSPFTSNEAITKIITENRPFTDYDPFELVEETLVTALKKWMTLNV